MTKTYVCSNPDCPTHGKVWTEVKVCPHCSSKMKKVTESVEEEPEAKKHRHSYRKDGTCACGAVRK